VMTRRGALRFGVGWLAAMSATLPGVRPSGARTWQAPSGAAAESSLPLIPQTWRQRSTAPGVVRALNFGDVAQASIDAASRTRRPGAPCVPGVGALLNVPRAGQPWPRRDTTTRSPAGNPSLRFDATAGAGLGGVYTVPFADDGSVQFGTDGEFWVQWCQYIGTRAYP